MNLLEEIEKVKSEGYSEANAQARVCQDMILYAISKGSLSQNVTIKGELLCAMCQRVLEERHRILI